MTRSDWGQLYVLSLLWAGTFLFVERIVGELPPVTIVLIRVAGGALILALALPLLRVPYPKGRSQWFTLAVMGLLNNMVPFTLFVIAQGEISAGMTAILNATTPIFTLISLRVFVGERLGGLRIFGVLAGICGVAVMMGGGAGGAYLAMLACLGAAACYGLSAVWGLRLRAEGILPQQAAFGQLLCSSLLLLPVSLVFERPWELALPSTGALIALAGLACFSTAFAYLLFFRIMASAGALALSLVTLLIPVNTLAISAALGGMLPSLVQVLGMALIGLGLLLIEMARRRAVRAAVVPDPSAIKA